MLEIAVELAKEIVFVMPRLCKIGKSLTSCQIGNTVRQILEGDLKKIRFYCPIQRAKIVVISFPEGIQFSNMTAFWTIFSPQR